MSDPLSEIKARFLLEDLNRRTRWFAILRGNHGSSHCSVFVPILLFLIAVIWTWDAFDGGQASALLMLVMALYGTMDLHTQGVHKRVDALVELLRQEGMLDAGLPALSKETGPTKREQVQSDPPTSA